MNKFLSYLVFLSILLVQVHGLSAHSETGSDNHNCAICEVQSHTPGVVASPVIIELAPIVSIVLVTPINVFIPKLNISLQASPRAPPRV